MKRVALYLRVSTMGQTVENQQRELEVAAERHGWQVVATFADEGIIGTKHRDKRPAFDRLCKVPGQIFDPLPAAELMGARGGCRHLRLPPFPCRSRTAKRDQLSRR